jgi:hypothetical protein
MIFTLLEMITSLGEEAPILLVAHMQICLSNYVLLHRNAYYIQERQDTFK